MSYSKSHSVKSNARRAARKAGVDPSAVCVAPNGGWHFPLPTGAADRPAKAAKVAKAAGKAIKPAKPAKTEKAKTEKTAKTKTPRAGTGEISGNRLIVLNAVTAKGGATMPELMKATGWAEHVIRARISELATAKAIKDVERTRFMKVTTYTAQRA